MKHAALVGACSVALAIPTTVSAERPATAAVCLGSTYVSAASKPPDLAATCLLKRSYYPPNKSPGAVAGQGLAGKAVGARYCTDTWRGSLTWRLMAVYHKAAIPGYCLVHAWDW